MHNIIKMNPSKFYQYELCPGSYYEEQKYPKDDNRSDSAIDGTHSHTLLEKCINDGVIYADKFLGSQMQDDDGTFTVDSARIDRVNVAIEYIQNRISELGVDKVTVVSEIYTDVGETISNASKGKIDVVLYTDDHIEVIDYKDGFTPVSVVANSQLELYALGIDTTKTKTIRMTIVQPNASIRGGDQVSFVEVPVEQLESMKERHNETVEAVKSGEGNLIAGEKQCRYCAHRANCKTRMTDSLEGVKIDMSTLDIAQKSANKEAGTMTDEELTEVFESLPALKAFIKDIEAEVENRLVKEGKKLPGLKVVLGNGGSEWGQEVEETEKKLKKFGIPKDEIWRKKFITPAQARTVKWKNKKGEVKKLSKRQLEMLESEYIKKYVGKPTVALESDTREAYVVDKGGDNFKPIVEEVKLPDWLK